MYVVLCVLLLLHTFFLKFFACCCEDVWIKHDGCVVFIVWSYCMLHSSFTDSFQSGPTANNRAELTLARVFGMYMHTFLWIALDDLQALYVFNSSRSESLGDLRSHQLDWRDPVLHFHQHFALSDVLLRRQSFRLCTDLSLLKKLVITSGIKCAGNRHSPFLGYGFSLSFSDS